MRWKVKRAETTFHFGSAGSGRLKMGFIVSRDSALGAASLITNSSKNKCQNGAGIKSPVMFPRWRLCRWMSTDRWSGFPKGVAKYVCTLLAYLVPHLRIYSKWYDVLTSTVLPGILKCRIVAISAKHEWNLQTFDRLTPQV